MTPDELDQKDRERLHRFLDESAHRPIPDGFESRVVPHSRRLRPLGRMLGAVVVFAAVAVSTAAAVFSSDTGPLHQHASPQGSTGQPTTTPLPSLPIEVLPGESLPGLGGAIEGLSGGVWSAISAPVPSALPGSSESQGVGLAGIACPSSDDCWAVGAGYGGSGGLIEHYDGSAWSIVGQPAEPLTAVACDSDTDCWAVGGVSGYLAQPVFEHYAGGAWEVVQGPALSDGGTLSGVSCPDADHCWAVGSGASDTGSTDATTAPLIEAYTGGVWTVVADPAAATGSGGDSFLSAVTCLSAADCWAVGEDASTGGGLIEHGDVAGWTVVPGPNAPGLVAVSCAGADDCWAVGGDSAEHYQGTAWTLVTGLLSGVASSLQSVSCVAPDACWVVGAEETGSERAANQAGLVYQLLIEGWQQGSGWTAVSSLPSGVDLEGVACLGEDSCWAVGSVVGGARFIFTSPSPSPGTAPLESSPATPGAASPAA